MHLATTCASSSLEPPSTESDNDVRGQQLPLAVVPDPSVPGCHVKLPRFIAILTNCRMTLDTSFFVYDQWDLQQSTSAHSPVRYWCQVDEVGSKEVK